MWKPTKKQHLTNKKYVDENGGGSGLDVFIVNFTTDYQTGTTTCDKTYDEIRAANAAGKVVIGLVNTPAGITQIFEYAGQPMEASYVMFIHYIISAESSGPGGTIMVLRLFVNSDGTVTDDSKTITIS